jgi:23S rRNA pseudouridine2605 synthase
LSIRLNKLLAERGIGARRKCDALIQSGSVRVNGSVVKEPGMRVEPERDRVSVEGRPLPEAAPLRYYALNKPVGVITTLDDPEHRRTIRELLPPGPRLFPVGRLDADTSGLLIVTNDGELAHRLMHPRYGVDKIYRVRLDRVPDARELDHLRSGVEFEPGITSGPARVRVLDPGPENAMIEISIHEGRYRQVRRMCEALGLRVLGLHRAGYGPLRLGPLARGMWRELSEVELRRLRSASSRPRPRPAFATRRAPSGPRRPGREEVVALRPRPAGPRRPEASRARRSRTGARGAKPRTSPSVPESRPSSDGRHEAGPSREGRCGPQCGEAEQDAGPGEWAASLHADLGTCTSGSPAPLRAGDLTARVGAKPATTCARPRTRKAPGPIPPPPRNDRRLRVCSGAGIAEPESLVP